MAETSEWRLQPRNQDIGEGAMKNTGSDIS